MLNVQSLTQRTFAQIVVFALLLLNSTLAFAQNQVNGIVTDKTGEPLIGVNVVEKGTTNGVITDFFFDVKRGTPIKDLVILVRQKGYENKSFFWFADSEMLKEFIRIAPEMKIKVNASNIAALKKWMKICTPAYVETDILNITPQFKEFCKSNHIKIMAAIQNASEKEYKKAIEAHPDLVNLDRPELFVKMLRQEIKK